MKKVFWVLIILTFISGAFFYVFVNHPMRNNNLILNKKEYEEAIAKAQSGDCQSMDKLYWHHDTLNEKNESKVWLEKWEKAGCKNKPNNP